MDAEGGICGGRGRVAVPAPTDHGLTDRSTGRPSITAPQHGFACCVCGFCSRPLRML
jgi:hypothetical protein